MFSMDQRGGAKKYQYQSPNKPKDPAIVFDKHTYKTPYAGLEMLISGGQTGADRAGLDAAAALKLTTGGTAPGDYLTENGPDLSLKKYGLVAVPNMTYKRRTQVNVEDSDATIAFRLQPGNGTDKTIGYCHSKVWSYGKDRAQTKEGPDVYRPVFVVTSLKPEDRQQTIQNLREFIQRNQVRIVNIAGHRETTAGMEGFSTAVQQFLEEALPPIIAPPATK